MSGVWEPHGGRAAGGLLGVAGGEAFRGVAFGSSNGPVTAALVDLCHGYVASRGQKVPVEVGERHEGVATPAWMLAVAVVRASSRERVSDTLELALAAGVPRGALADCVAYVDLAAALFAGQPVDEALTARRVADAVHRGAALRLSGEGPADAIGAGVWALRHPGGLAAVMPVLAREATPGVAAAAGGLLGLRDGSTGMPPHWQRRVRAAAACMALAPGLVRARCRDHREPAVAAAAAVGVVGSVGVIDALDTAGSLEGAERSAEVAPVDASVKTCRPARRPLRGLVARTRRTAVLDRVDAR